MLQRIICPLLQCLQCPDSIRCPGEKNTFWSRSAKPAIKPPPAHSVPYCSSLLCSGRHLVPPPPSPLCPAQVQSKESSHSDTPIPGSHHLQLLERASESLAHRFLPPVRHYGAEVCMKNKTRTKRFLWAQSCCHFTCCSWEKGLPSVGQPASAAVPERLHLLGSCNGHLWLCEHTQQSGKARATALTLHANSFGAGSFQHFKVGWDDLMNLGRKKWKQAAPAGFLKVMQRNSKQRTGKGRQALQFITEINTDTFHYKLLHLRRTAGLWNGSFSFIGCS